MYIQHSITFFPKIVPPTAANVGSSANAAFEEEWMPHPKARLTEMVLAKPMPSNNRTKTLGWVGRESIFTDIIFLHIWSADIVQTNSLLSDFFFETADQHIIWPKAVNIQYVPLHITLEPKLPAAALEVTSVSATRQGWPKEMPMNLRNQDLCLINFLQIYELVSLDH